ncbi:MAG: hypothetical protein JWN24_1553 [Phycisphaerales bacterium]|jgi:hypothetical protein|nr:hypothetical protein [Phycisphaerales bacterium]
MSRFVGYYSRFNDLKGDLTGLPPWARTVFVAFALPGIALLALSIVAVIASVAVLLAVCIPVYTLLRALTARGRSAAEGEPETWPRQVKHVDATVRDADLIAPDEQPNPQEQMGE